MNYIISSWAVPRQAYALGDGIALRPVKPLPQMYEYGLIPHDYEAVIALTMRDDTKTPEAYNTYRNLAIFHSFLSDDDEVFQCAVEKGIKDGPEDSELTLMPTWPNGLDFDRFPVPVPMTRDEDFPLDDNSQRPANYLDVFKKFCDFGNSSDSSLVNLQGQIFSYVFARSISDVSNVGLLYNNSNLLATFYVAILEDIIGEPPFCEDQVVCPKCGPQRKHYAKPWREHIADQLDILADGWGTRYVDAIWKSRERRHQFAHGAKYSDPMQRRWKIYDKSHYHGQQWTEADSHEESRIEDDEVNLKILERTVRMALVTRFLATCGPSLESPR